jgi:hypothetical protein
MNLKQLRWRRVLPFAAAAAALAMLDSTDALAAHYCVPSDAAGNPLWTTNWTTWSICSPAHVTSVAKGEGGPGDWRLTVTQYPPSTSTYISMGFAYDEGGLQCMRYTGGSTATCSYAATPPEKHIVATCYTSDFNSCWWEY